jgi:putative ABC transport system permease protein
MNFYESLRVALHSLFDHPLRTALATLGIAIGIAAVSSLLSFGQSFQRFAASQFAGLETDVLVIMAQPDYGSLNGSPPEQARLTNADIAAIQTLPNVRAVVARYVSSGEIQAGGTVGYGTIIGAEPDALRPHMGLALGRFLSSADLRERRRVAVLNWPLAQQLFPDGRPLGRTIIMQGMSVQVIGVLASQESDPFNGGTVTLPITLVRDRLVPAAALSGIQVTEATIYLEQPEQLVATQASVRDLLRERHRLRDDQGNDFSFQNPGEFVGAVDSVQLGITIFLGIIGGISLIVGGIGIFNIMLVSVAERTREIGLRKAVGARRRDILAQFLVEALMLSLLGGGFGLLIALILINGGAVVVQIMFTDLGIAPYMLLDLPGVALALGSAALVGLLAGIYPALNASRLTPIDALRTM